MKKSKLTIMALTALVSQLIGVSSGSAQETCPAYVNVTGISTNAAGNLVYHEYDNRDIIRQSADEAGLTNLAGLRLVYDRTNDAVEVVSGTNDTVVSAALTFTKGIALSNSNTNDTRIQRLSRVYWGGSTNVNGTLLAGEEVIRGNAHHSGIFTLNGQLQFAVRSDGTNSPVIFTGNVSAAGKN